MMSATVRNTVGLLAAALSGLLFASSTAIIQQLLNQEYDVFSTTAITSTLLLLQTPVIAAASQAPWLLPVRTMGWVFIRTATGIVAVYLVLFASKYLPLGEVLIFTCLSPPLTAVTSTCILREKVKLLDATTLVLAVIGAILLMLPALTNLATEASCNTVIGGLLGIGAAIAYTSSHLSHCYALREVNPWSVIQIYSSLFALSGIVVVIVRWKTVLLPLCNNRILTLTASTILFWNPFFINTALMLTTAGLAAQTTFATRLISGFLIQIALGNPVTWWSGMGASCVSLALALNIGYHSSQLILNKS